MDDDKEFVFLGFNLYLFGKVGIVEIIMGWFYGLGMFLLNMLVDSALLFWWGAINCDKVSVFGGRNWK